MFIFLCAAVVLAVSVFIYGYRSENRSRKTPKRTRCSVCGTTSVVWNNQFCSPQCEARLAKSMDDWHDRFEEMDEN